LGPGRRLPGERVAAGFLGVSWEENNAAKPFSAEAYHGINPLFGVLVRLHLLERYTVFKTGAGMLPDRLHNLPARTIPE